MQSLNKKYCKHFQKSMILKRPRKKKSLRIPISKVFVENLRESKKQYLKNKRKDLMV